MIDTATKDLSKLRTVNASDAPEYRSSHFNEPNILAHMRVNDRIDADGKKMLLIEEIQSDWHQAGREKGYQNKSGIYGEKVTPEEYKRGVELQNQQRNQSEPLTPLEQTELSDIMTRHEASIVGARVPDAPFKDTWYQLALKRVMKYAADNGYERVGLTTGKQQAKRYDLSKQVGEVHYNPDTQELQAYPKDMEKDGYSPIINEVVPPNKLSDYIGKEASEKLLNKKLTKIPTEKGDTLRHILKNADLQIGGEGMKKYYDEIYPKFLEKYGKKWDAGVGETKIITEDNAWNMAEQIKQRGISDAQWRALSEEDKLKLWNDIKQSVGRKQEPIRYIDITPKMKESVGKGQPLFTAIPAGTLGLGGLEYADPFASPLTEDTTR